MTILQAVKIELIPASDVGVNNWVLLKVPQSPGQIQNNLEKAENMSWWLK